MVQGRYVFPFSQLRMTDVDRVGGKNASLGELLSQLKAGTPHSYMTLENGVFTWKELGGEAYHTESL